MTPAPEDVPATLEVALPEPTPVVLPLVTKPATRAGIVAHFEEALQWLIEELDHEGTIAIHGIHDELRALKSFATYALHALKGKLGLL